MIDLYQLNIQAGIMFGIMLIILLLGYIAFFKGDVDKRLRSSKRS